VEGSGGGGIINAVAKQVVAAGAVTATTAYQSMVAEAIHDSVATGTLVILVRKRDAQPALQHCDEQRGLVVQASCFAGSRMEIQACSTGRDKAEVSTRGRVRGGNELIIGSGIDGL